ELLGIRLATLGLIAVIERAQLDRMAVDAAGRIDGVEVDACAAIHLDAQLRGGPAERGRLAEHQALRLSKGGRSQSYCCGSTEPGDGVATIHSTLPRRSERRRLERKARWQIPLGCRVFVPEVDRSRRYLRNFCRGRVGDVVERLACNEHGRRRCDEPEA